MSDIVVGASIQVDAGNTAPTIKEVRENIKQYKQELDNVTVGSEQHKAALEKLRQANEQLNPTFKDQGAAVSALKNQVASAVPAFGQAAQGAQGFGTTLKALMANPIVLMLAGIVAGLKLLWDAFSSVAVFGDKVDAVLSGIGAAMQEVRDRVLLTASAIYKFFTGDFKGAFADAKKAATGLGDAIVDAFKRGKEAGEQMDAAMDQMRVLNMVQADMNKKLAEARELLTDETASYKDKKRALQEVKNTEDAYYSDLAKQHESYAEGVAKKYGVEKKFQEMVKAGTAEAKKTFDDYLQTILKDDKIKEIEDAYIQAQGAVQEYHDRQRANNKMDARIDREERQKEAQAQKEADDKKKQQDEKNREEEEKREAAHKAYLEDLERKYQENLKHIREQAEKEMREADQQAAQKLADQEKRKDLDLRESKLRMDRNKKNLLFLRQELDGQMALKDWYYQLDLAAAGDNALKKREIEVKHNEEMAQLSEQRKAISKAEAEAKAADLDTLGNALNSISDLIGKQTVVGKGLAIATSLINTYQGATKALAQGGMFGFIGAAGVIAAGIASVQKIISTQIPGQASGGGSAGATASTSAPLQPKPQVGTTQLDQQSINGIGNAASGRTFVVDKDIQNNRERAERLNRAARIG
jgi:hypothetical protein